MTLQKRLLGSTGFDAFILGLGDLADRAVPIEMCVVTIHRAMDFFPNEQEAAFEALRSFRPFGAEQMDETRRRVAHAIEGKGPSWWNPDS
jgi:hypothetical protein